MNAQFCRIKCNDYECVKENIIFDLGGGCNIWLEIDSYHPTTNHTNSKYHPKIYVQKKYDCEDTRYPYGPTLSTPVYSHQSQRSLFKKKIPKQHCISKYPITKHPKHHKIIQPLHQNQQFTNKQLHTWKPSTQNNPTSKKIRLSNPSSNVKAKTRVAPSSPYPNLDPLSSMSKSLFYSRPEHQAADPKLGWRISETPSRQRQTYNPWWFINDRDHNHQTVQTPTIQHRTTGSPSPVTTHVVVEMQ